MKGNSAKGKSQGAMDINFALDNIKAQIIKHYQKLSDREAFVTAEMVHVMPIRVSVANMKRLSGHLTRIVPTSSNVWEKTALLVHTR